ncbi:hypothetical protein MUK42_19870, partial [Musa troglodytarum]
MDVLRILFGMERLAAPRRSRSFRLPICPQERLSSGLNYVTTLLLVPEKELAELIYQNATCFYSLILVPKSLPMAECISGAAGGMAGLAHSRLRLLQTMEAKMEQICGAFMETDTNPIDWSVASDDGMDFPMNAYLATHLVFTFSANFIRCN